MSDNRAKKRVFRRWAIRFVSGVFALVALLALAGLAYQAIASARDARQYLPPGRMIDVGGYRLHIRSMGEGGPTVVLDAGWSDCSLNWCLVQPEVAQFTRVCSYDHAGLGWSDPGPAPRTSQQIVHELHTLLTNAGLPGPYVLVGHSFGGYNVRLFAHEYPQEVAGLVLVESSHEDQWAGMPESMKRQNDQFTTFLKTGLPWQRFGVVRRFYTYPNPKLPEALRPIDVALKSRTGFLNTIYNEAIGMEESGTQVKAAPSLPPVPLAVLTAGEMGKDPPPGISAEDFERWKSLWRDLQADLARRCPDSIHVTVADSTHIIPLDRPAAVVDAIRRVVEAVREHKPLQAPNP